MAKNDNRTNEDQATPKTASANKPGKVTMRYIGPDYGSAVVLPGVGQCRPKDWDEKRIKKTLERWPQAARYFSTKE